MNTKTLLIIILTLFSIAPLVISHTLILLQQETINTNTAKQLNAIANIQHERIQQFINNKRESVRLISANTQLNKTIINASLTINSNKNIAKLINAPLTAISSIENIIIYSAEKHVLYSSVDSALLSHYQLSNQRYIFKENVLNIKVHQKDKQSITIEIVEPLLSSNKVIGYIFVEFSARELLAILSDYNGLGDTGEIVLAAKNDIGHIQFLTPTRLIVTSLLVLLLIKTIKHIL